MSQPNQRYVLIRGQVYRWEEKAPFVPSGRSYEGAVEYDLGNDALRCHECGEWRQRLNMHIARVHSDIGNAEYKVRHGLRVGHALIAPSLKADIATRPAELARRAAASERFRGKWSKERRFAMRADYLARERKAGFVRIYRSKEQRNEQKTCDAQILFGLKRLIVAAGRIPFCVEIEQPMRSTLLRRFGSLENALKRLEIDPGREFDAKSVLIEDLRDFYVLNRRLPRSNEFGEGRLASLRVYEKRFGCLPNAYDEAGLYKVWEQELNECAHLKNILPGPAEFEAHFTAA